MLAGFSADIGIYDLTNDSRENIINALPDLIIVGPLIETILCQALPYEILKKFTPKIWILILSAITFGLLHFEGKTAMILLATLDGLF
ncbi:CAAX amino terminal protease self- immunity [Amantichitinum ursilacus]|uniref:CAAX amino terminal protease self-immunity n=1 Tax=Amantichitinum ursilacus TaxID=857265 RepID=A0A0N0XJR8_9NEIS|nr:CAAX amino terminal protease self- immunity [Amantichitinum ursilacus]